MKWVGGIILACVLVVLSACGGPDADRIPGPRLIEEGEFEIVATVALSESGFDPDSVEIEPGEVIAIEISGPEPDRIRGYIDEEITSDTGELLPGETTLVRLTTPGEVSYESESGSVLAVTVLAVDSE